MFPDQDIKKNDENNEIEKCFLFQNLIETDSTSVFFILLQIFMSNRWRRRDVIFDVLIKSKILERFDLSDDFWDRFGVQNNS